MPKRAKIQPSGKTRFDNAPALPKRPRRRYFAPPKARIWDVGPFENIAAGRKAFRQLQALKHVDGDPLSEPFRRRYHGFDAMTYPVFLTPEVRCGKRHPWDARLTA